MQLGISTTRQNTCSTFALAGRLTVGESADSFRATMARAFATGDQKVILDLAEVSYIDSSGLAELVRAHILATEVGATLELANIAPRVQDLLEVSHLFTVFQRTAIKGH